MEGRVKPYSINQQWGEAAMRPPVELGRCSFGSHQSAHVEMHVQLSHLRDTRPRQSLTNPHEHHQHYLITTPHHCKSEQYINDKMLQPVNDGRIEIRHK